MGRFDRRNSMKMKRRKAQTKKKEREQKRRAAPVKAPARPSTRKGATQASGGSSPAPPAPTLKIKMSGGKRPPAPINTRLPISVLVPLEGAVVGPAVTAYRATLASGGALPAAEVVVINGEHLVVDGSNRVYAAKLEGRVDVDVVITPGSGMVAKSRAHGLKHALRRGRKGFEGVAVAASDAERETFTEQERVDDEKHDFGT